MHMFSAAITLHSSVFDESILRCNATPHYLTKYKEVIMTKTNVRIKVAIAYAIGLLTAGIYSAAATDSEVTTQLNKPTAGIHCPAYDNVVNEEFTCNHVDEEGEVVKTTTFLVTMGPNGNPLPISISGAVEADQADSTAITADFTTGNSPYGSVDEPPVVVDEPDVDASVVTDDVTDVASGAEEAVQVTEEGVDDGHWKWVKSFKAAYNSGLVFATGTYDSVFGDTDSDEPVVESVPEPAVEEEAPVVIEAAPTPVDATLEEASEVEVVQANWMIYAEQAMTFNGAEQFFQREVHWLAMNMVFEARNQGDIGMIAVADVTIKRLDIHLRGDVSIYGVVTNPAEFSWYGDEVLDILTMNELLIYDEAKEIADTMLLDYASGNWLPTLASDSCPDGSTHYHKTDIVPNWQASMLADCGVIGDHHFWYGK